MATLMPNPAATNLDIIINKIKKEERERERERERESKSEITRRGGVVVLGVGRGSGRRRDHVGAGLTHPRI